MGQTRRCEISKVYSTQYSRYLLVQLCFQKMYSKNLLHLYLLQVGEDRRALSQNDFLSICYDKVFCNVLNLTVGCGRWDIIRNSIRDWPHFYISIRQFITLIDKAMTVEIHAPCDKRLVNTIFYQNNNIRHNSGIHIPYAQPDYWSKFLNIKFLSRE